MSNYPTVRPSLTLDFQKSKQLDPRIAFSRASSATYVEDGVIKTADEHQARFEQEGLLIEESRVNFVKANTTGSDAGWDYGAESTDVKPPTGGTDSVRKGEYLRLKRNNLTAPSGTYQAWITVFVNTASWSRFAFRTVTGGIDYFFFDLSGPTPRVEERHGNNIITDVNPEKYICEQLANGWWRIGYRNWNSINFGYRQIWRFDWDANDEPIVIGNFPAGAPANTFIYAWGGQMEIGAKASSFIPNNGTNSITRAADVCKITGDDFSSWYNQSEGTVFAKSSYFGLSTGSLDIIYEINDGGTANRHHLMLREADDDLRIQTRSGSVNGFEQLFSRPAENQLFSNALGYKINDCASSLDGSNPVNDNSVQIPTVDRMFIGSRNLGDFLNGHISRIAYYSERLTDTQLEVITS